MWHSETPVEALMTLQPVTVSPFDDVRDAVALLERYPFRHLPVVQENELVGIVSARDLALAAALPRGARARGHGPRIERRVEEISRRPVHTVPPSRSARRAVEAMLEHRIGCLPVVDGGGLLGIVTETDFLRLFERCGCSSENAPNEATVATSLCRPVQTCAPEDDLLEAMERMQTAHVRHLPVVAGQAVVGMLSDRDVRRGLARLVREDRHLEAVGSASIPQLRVADVMTTPCLTIERDRTLRAAARQLIENRIGALVVFYRQEMVGILSQRDLLERYRDWSSISS